MKYDDQMCQTNDIDCKYNKKWYDENSIPDDEAELSTFSIAEKHTAYQLYDLLQSFRKNNPKSNITEICNVIDACEEKFLDADVSIIKKIYNFYSESKSIENVAELPFIIPLLNFDVNYDIKPPKNTILQLTRPCLISYDEDHRITDDREFIETYLEKLSNQIKKDFGLIINHKVVYEIENQMPVHINKNAIVKNINDYPLVKKIIRKYRINVKKINIISEKTINIILNFLTDLKKTRDYFLLSFFHFNCPMLPSAYRKIRFDNWYSPLTGQKKQQDKKIIDLEKYKIMIPDFLSDLYNKAYCDGKEDVEMLITNIKKSAVELIQKSGLTKKTKEKAIEKINKMKQEVCPQPIIVPRNFVDKSLFINLLQLNFDSFCLFIRDNLKTPTTPIKQNNIANYEINAIYYLTDNSMIIPTGLIQKPFFVKGDINVNYSCIGHIISHELMHAFDVVGKKYDADGFMIDWWSDEDEKIYSESIDKIKDLSGDKLSGLSETVADVGGMKIAMNIHNKLGGDPEKFIKAWAHMWRNKSTDKYDELAKKTDIHSSPNDRLNIIPLYANRISESLKYVDDAESKISFFIGGSNDNALS